MKQFKKGYSDNSELSENSEFPVRLILRSLLSSFAIDILSMTHEIMLGRQGGKFGIRGLPSVKNVFEVLTLR